MELTLEGRQLGEWLKAFRGLLGLHLPGTRVIAVRLLMLIMSRDHVRANDSVPVVTIIIVPRGGIQFRGERRERG